MYKLKWIVYLIFSLIGGAVFQKFIPGSSLIENSIWFLGCDILYEILEWKYSDYSEEGEKSYVS